MSKTRNLLGGLAVAMAFVMAAITVVLSSVFGWAALVLGLTLTFLCTAIAIQIIN